MQTPLVRYAHDGQIVCAPWHGNSHTVLQHLREQRRLTGTKEGCAEGDCGACIVLIGELMPDATSVRYRSANACFMPLSALQGRLLVTVESLGRPGALHPVQQALVEEHGSQCGFCTPGFAMSLYEQYLHHRAATTAEQVHQQLSGNLCRCTGYAPILRAAQTMFALPRQGRDDAADLSILQRLAIEAADARLETTESLALLPRSGDELASARAAHPDAVLLGGSTDVGLWITKQLKALPKVIHVDNVPQLKVIEPVDAGLRIGAAASLTDAFAALNVSFPELRELWSRFASPAVRHRGTLGGNIASGSPIGDSMPALIALGARLVLRGGDSRREVLLDDFYLGYQCTALAAGEFIEAIIVPPRTSTSFVRVYKVSKRVDDDISAVCLALALDLDGLKIRSARLAFGGMAAIPKRATHTEAALCGQIMNEQTMVQAAATLAQDFKPISDHRASAAYRLKVAGNLLLRAAVEHLGSEPVRVCAPSGVAA